MEDRNELDVSQLDVELHLLLSGDGVGVIYVPGDGCVVCQGKLDHVAGQLGTNHCFTYRSLVIQVKI